MPYNADGTWTPEGVPEKVESPQPVTTAVQPHSGTSSPTTTSTPRPTTAERINELTSKNSPLQQQARTRANQTANSKGLLNSSMAVQAGELAALGAALPIAQQDSEQAHKSALAQQNFEHTRDLSAQDYAQRTGLLNQELSSREKIAAQGNEKDISIANLNVAANDREKATSALVAMENVYSQMFESVAGNPNIPAKARDAYLNHIGYLRDSSLGLVEQMFAINLTWNTKNETPAVSI